MITLRLYLENIAGDWFGWIEQFPGAYSQGATPQEAERAAPRAFTEYLRWLTFHGEQVPDEMQKVTTADFFPSVAEAIAGCAGAPRDARHFLAEDARPLQAQELERYLRLLRCSRATLVEAAGAIPPHEWDSAPLGGRSIRASLQALGEAEAAMFSRIGIEPTLRAHADPLAALGRNRALFESAARSALDHGGISTVESESGRWSLPKVLRLAVWTERHYAAQIAARSNPAAYMKSVLHAEAVVRNRDGVVRSDSSLTSSADDGNSAARHTHASGYYY